MRVRVHRKADLRVAEHLHHHARRDVLSQEEAGARVSQVMEAAMGQARLLEQPLEALRHVRPVEGGSDWRGEDEARFFPSGAGEEPLFQLTRPVLAAAAIQPTRAQTPQRVRGSAVCTLGAEFIAKLRSKRRLELDR